MTQALPTTEYAAAEEVPDDEDQPREQPSDEEAVAADSDDKVEDKPPKSSSGKCCGWTRFEGSTMSQGYATLGVSRGAVVMSNIFLSTSLIYLANNHAGCLNEEDKVIEGCNARVYGQSPAALIANIAVFSGLLSAFFMPLVGAMVDYTPYRKPIGVSVAVVMIVVQAVQIATIPSTWFAMAILQGIAGFLYQMQVLASYAYLPDILRDVGAKSMTSFQSTFTMCQFAAQSVFLIIIIGISSLAGLSTVVTAQTSQSINVVWSGLFFFLGWRLLPGRPASHELPVGKTLVTQAFSQVWGTTRHINKYYRKSLRWFLLAVVFAEAAVNAFTVVSVVFLDEQIGMSTTQIGIFFLITLVMSLPGSRLGAWITSKVGPARSYQGAMFCLMITAIVGALIMDEGLFLIAYGWGAVIGVFLGWFYPTENLAFSILLPKGQEAEIAGFYVYCTQILGWLPPLIFSLLVEADVHQKFGIIAVQVFFVVAIGIVFLMPKWSDCVVEIILQDKVNEGIYNEEEIKDLSEEQIAAAMRGSALCASTS